MDVTVRKLTEGDVDAARAVHTEAFADHDRQWGEPVADVTPESIERQRRRLRHFLAHDPEGAWVADYDGSIVGVALALRRDRLWGLSLLVVDPAAQGQRVGARLLAAALAYADPVGPAVILSSRDPRAMHRYASAGFDLHPQVRAGGKVNAARLPAAAARVREGTDDDFTLADRVDVEVRGAARGPDHAILCSTGPMFVVDDGAGRGYAHMSGGRVLALAATDDATATALLWRCLAHAADADAEAVVEHVNGAQQWAVRVLVEAGLSMAPCGPVFWRGRVPPPGYLPSGPYL